MSPTAPPRPKLVQVQQLTKLAKAYPLFAGLLAPELPALKTAYEQRRQPRPGHFAQGELVMWHAPGGYDGHDWPVRLSSEAQPSFEYGTGDFRENYYRFEPLTPHPLCILRVAPERELLAMTSYVAPAPARPGGSATPTLPPPVPAPPLGAAPPRSSQPTKLFSPSASAGGSSYPFQTPVPCKAYLKKPLLSSSKRWRKFSPARMPRKMRAST